MSDKVKKFQDTLLADLRSLASETKRKHAAVKEVILLVYNHFLNLTFNEDILCQQQSLLILH